jgi:hypothetical protein
VRLVAGVDRELAHALALATCTRHEINALQRAAGLSNGSGQPAQGLRPSIKLDPNDH